MNALGASDTDSHAIQPGVGQCEVAAEFRTTMSYDAVGVESVRSALGNRATTLYDAMWADQR